MNVRCKNCQAKLNIPDHKIPKNKDAAFKCPKCGEKVQVRAPDGTPGKAPAPEPGTPAPLFQKGMRALLVISDPALLEKYRTAVRQLGYEAEVAEDAADACKKMEYHVYPLAVLEEGGSNGKESVVLEYMNTLDMSIRRMTCLVLASKVHKTSDHMAAMHKSVNYIAGTDAEGHLATVLSVALTDHNNFYTVFTESLKAVGKA